VVNQVFEEVFLFREVQTEALKVLLPVQDFDTEENIQMFSAGIKTALRLFFQGSPDHIRTWDYREFNTHTQRFDRYLVLYDSIPGGTGYLQKLFDKEAFTRLLTLAWQHLKNCGCQYRGNDGCYRCIYDYSNQYVRESLSRRQAEQLFEKLVQQGANWQYLQHGLGSLSGTGQIEESELEDRFIRSLKNAVKKQVGTGWQWHEERKGTVRYHLTLTNGDESFTWQITPQRALGAAQGLPFSTRVDFHFVLTQYKKNGVVQQDAAVLEEALRWLVYLDGYDYHGSAQNCRFYSDLSRRLAIAHTHPYRSYTLTWQDLDRFDHNLHADKSDYKRDGINCLQDKYANTRKALKGHPALGECQSDLSELPDSLFRFLWLLTHPFNNASNGKKTGWMFGMMQVKLASPSFDVANMPGAMFAPDAVQSVAKQMTGGNFFIMSDASVCFPFACLRVGVNMKDFQMYSGITWNDTIRSIDKDAWASFWPVFNLVQQSAEIVNPIYEIPNRPSENVTDNDKEDWREYYAEDLQPIVAAMLRAGCYVNLEGDFFLQEKGFPHATAELGHYNKKWFIRAISPEDKEVFIKAGYTELTTETFTNEMI
jgi:DEAD/DEAH box helicase domain-containing protein